MVSVCHPLQGGKMKRWIIKVDGYVHKLLNDPGDDPLFYAVYWMVGIIIITGILAAISVKLEKRTK